MRWTHLNTSRAPGRMCTMATKLTVLLVVALISISLTAGEMPVDCCQRVTDFKFVHKNCRRVDSYILKDAQTGCHRDATVFITRKGLKLCVPYPSQSQNVRDCIAAVDGRGARK